MGPGLKKFSSSIQDSFYFSSTFSNICETCVTVNPDRSAQSTVCVEFLSHHFIHFTGLIT